MEQQTVSTAVVKAAEEAISGKLLTPEQRGQIDSIKSGINFTDTTAILQFGTKPQAKLAEFSDSILQSVKMKDAGQAGELLGKMMDSVKSLNVQGISQPGALSKIPLVGSLFDSFKRFLERYESVAAKIDEVVAGLEKEKLNMLRDIQTLDRLYEENLELLAGLELYIRAGEEKLRELKEITIPEARAKAQASGDTMEAQRVRDFEQMATRFEKKIHDLKLNRTIAIQNAPQIRLAQEGNKTLAEKLQSSLFHTIPLWKSQMVMAIALYRQGRALAVQKEVSDTTNELLTQNAQMLKDNSVQIARETERGIVDIETLKKVNQELIATIDETLRIQKEGKEKRVQAEVELQNIEKELKDRLLQAGTEGR